MNKYLFLDVDGVLNTDKSRSIYGLSKPCLRRLRLIHNDTDCRLVLSSTWRKSQYATRRLERVLQYRGMALYSKTPVLNNIGTVRGDEIKMWLELLADEPYRYAILDDDSDMLDEQLPSFFQTDPQHGLTNAIAYRVTYHLNQGL